MPAPLERQLRVSMIDSSHSLDLSACDREPIHIPGAIQPHGAVLVVDPERMEIVQVAGDVAALLGPSVEALLGSPLEKAGRALAQLVEGSAGASARPMSLGRLLLPEVSAAVEITLHRSGDVLAIEVEPAGPERDLAQELSRLNRIGGDLDAAPDMESLLDDAAEHVRALTGFDRVMVYRFLRDGSGLVVAEACDPNTRSYLHHRFPASDIPAQARALYLRNPIRAIPDVHYVPAPLVPQENPRTGGPLDLSDCALRSVSPVHLQYLRNMGVRASMSLSIVVSGELWGLVACHHRRPRAVSPAAREMCTLFARFISHQVRARDEDQHHRQAARLQAGIEAWLAQASAHGFRRSVSERLQGLRALLPCDGLAVAWGDTFLRDGKTPPEDAVCRILPWLFEAEDGTCRATDHLAGIDPRAAEYAAVASGALGAVVSAADSVAVLWFRAEQVETIKWGGNPEKPAEISDVGALTPRRSFETWKQIVRQRGQPWTEASQEAGALIARRMAALYQSEKLDALNRELARTISRQDELMAQMDLLVREMNHRVQNNLQTVTALLRLYSADSEDKEVRTRFEEAERRIMAIGRVHHHLWRTKTLGSVDMGQYLSDLRDELIATWGAEWEAVFDLKTESVTVPVATAVPLALVATELLTNAVKYAYGGAAGPVELRLERSGEDRVSLIVSDRGAGGAVPKPRGGFGTRLIRTMVSSLGGTLRVDSADTGTIVHLDLPLQEP